MQGEQVWPGDVQAVHLQLPHHLLRRILLELPQEVGWRDVQSAAAAFSLLVMVVISVEGWKSFTLLFRCTTEPLKR